MAEKHSNEVGDVVESEEYFPTSFQEKWGEINRQNQAELLKSRTEKEEEKSIGGNEGLLNRLYDEALKRPLQGENEKEYLRKKRNLLEEIPNLTSSIVLHLFPKYFQLHDTPVKYEYDKEGREFLECVEEGELPFDLVDLMEKMGNPNPIFYDGCLVAEIFDHRELSSHLEVNLKNGNSNSSENGKKKSKKSKRKQVKSFKILLKPTYASVVHDVEEMRRKSGREWSDDELIKLEQDILNHSHQDSLCFDPSPEVAILNNFLHFNRRKFRTNKRARLNPENLKLSKNQTKESASDKKSPLNLISFLQKKSEEPPKPGNDLERAIHQQINKVLRQFPVPTANLGRNLPFDSSHTRPDLLKLGGNKDSELMKLLNNRKLRFSVNGKSFCTFQVAMNATGGFVGIIRTSTHDTVEFPLGNAQMAEAAVAQLRALYEKEGQVVDSSLEEPDNIPHPNPQDHLKLQAHSGMVQPGMNVKPMGPLPHVNPATGLPMNINFNRSNINALATHLLGNNDPNNPNSGLMDANKKMIHKLGSGGIMNMSLHPMVQQTMLAQQNALNLNANGNNPMQIFRTGSNPQMLSNAMHPGMSTLLQQQAQAQAQMNVNNVNFKGDPKS